MAQRQEVIVERLTTYSDEDAAAIGRLMPFLSVHATGQAIPEKTLRAIIESPDREQFAARLEGRIVGSAVLNTIIGNLNTKAWLEDFVTDPEVRRTGVGQAIWTEMIHWCEEKGVDQLAFTSRRTRGEAHNFYRQQGAQIKNTTAFEIPIRSK